VCSTVGGGTLFVVGLGTAVMMDMGIFVETGRQLEECCCSAEFGGRNKACSISLVGEKF